MVYSNKLLMEKDQEICAQLATINNVKERVTYHCNLDFQASSDDVVLIDEGDEYLYFQTETLINLLKDSQASCICLTATAGDVKGDTYEKKLLEHVGFKIFIGTPPEELSALSWSRNSIDNFEENVLNFV